MGIQNINVLIDGHYYSELLNNPTGDEMKLASGYSIYPIFQNTVFHPKIWFLTGKEEGLLIIGSGNLTYSGNSNNDEIWGAFHFSTKHSDNAGIFSAAWSYINHLCSSSEGLFNEKTNRWFIDNSKWLNSLPAITPFNFLSIANNEQIAFLYNDTNSSIWQQIINLIGNEIIIEITTISPFYDIEGKALIALKQAFPNAEINVVIEKSATFPQNLQDLSNFHFFDWQSIRIRKNTNSDSEEFYYPSKLHAKIIHFKTKNSTEFCLFGSANVTLAGLGINIKNANTEVSLLYKSTKTSNLEKLGIVLGSPVPFNHFQSHPFSQPKFSLISSNSFKIKLFSAEIVFDELHIFSSGGYSNPVCINFFDYQCNICYNEVISCLQPNEILKPSFPLNEIHHIQFFDNSSNSPISNKVLISDVISLNKTNPNSKSERLESLLNEIQQGDNSKIVELLKFAIDDDTENESLTQLQLKSSKKTNHTDTKKTPLELYDLNSYNQLDNSLLSKHVLLNSTSFKILDALKLIIPSKRINQQVSEIQSDLEELDMATISGDELNEPQKNQLPSLSEIKSNKRKIISYFEFIDKLFTNVYLEKQYSNDYKINHTDISRYSIALELARIYGATSFMIPENGIIKYHKILSFNEEKPYTMHSMKGSIFKLLGAFLLSCRLGFNEYTFTHTQNQFCQLKYDALLSTITSILFLNWSDSEKPYFKTALLNSLHYLGDNNPNTCTDFLNQLTNDISAKIASMNSPRLSISDNFIFFNALIIPAFIETLNRINSKLFDKTARRGSIIYISLFGYCYAKNVTDNNKFVLTRPGFLWDNLNNDYTRYNSDTHCPTIELKSFIALDI